MAAYVKTGTMDYPQRFGGKQLGHLGLVAGMYDELGDFANHTRYLSRTSVSTSR